MPVKVGGRLPGGAWEYWQRGRRTAGRLSLADHAGRWLVLFFYWRDFSFICPTELAALAALAPEFEREDAVLIAASTDSTLSHRTWLAQDERLAGVGFPIIADTSHDLARAFGVLDRDGAALRATVIADPTGVVRSLAMQHADAGRNIAEILRTLRAYQTGQLCEANWQPGDDAFERYSHWLTRIFPRLKTAALGDVARRLAPMTYDAGDIIIRQGAVADRFYILISGEVSVIHRKPDGEEVEVARLGEGDVFGEMGLITGGRRTADVRADTAVSLLVLDWEGFRRMIDSSDPTARDFKAIVEARRRTLAD